MPRLERIATLIGATIDELNLQRGPADQLGKGANALLLRRVDRLIRWGWSI
ncbi:MAG: hypothetical protein ACJ0UT_03845 [Candidatus Latescibacterota bacterium]